jgi:MFS family permease
LNKAQNGKSRIASVSLRMLSSLKIPGFRFYYLTTLGQSVGLIMGQVTGPLLMYRLTGSTVLLGTTSLVLSVPMIITSFLGGAVADRVSKKQIIFASILCFAAVNLVVAASLHTGLLSREHAGSWIILLIMSFIQGILMGIMMPALQSVIPEIVPKDLLMNASTLNVFEINVLGLIVPTLTGLIIDHIGFEYAYYATAGFYVFGAVFVLFIPRASRMAGSGGKILADIKNGLVYIRRTPTVMLILLFTTAMVVLLMPYQQFLPVFTENILKVGATGMGLLMSVSGGGALAGSLIMALIPARRRGKLLLASGLIAGVALLIFAFSSVWALSLGMMVFVGLSSTLRNTIGNTLLLTYSNAGFVGRVMSLLNMQWGLMAFVTFFAGLLAGIFSIQWVIGGLVIALIFITLLFMLFSPTIKKLE